MTSYAIVCGGAGKPDLTNRVSLRSRHHPGFGAVTFLRNGKVIDCDMGHGDWGEQHTLQWYENRAKKNPRARWEVRVDGPLSGYTLRRIRGHWFVAETNGGFA